MDEKTCESITASEGSLANDVPPLLNSRLKKFRTIPRAKSEAVRLRKVSWRKRFGERLSKERTQGASADPQITSTNHGDAAPQIDVKPVASNSRGPCRSPESLIQFRRLQRPSEVVPDIEDGSASDAGLTKDQKPAHRRRVLASALLLNNLSPHGIPQAIHAWERALGGHKLYSPFLVPPKADQFIRQYRVPSTCLSRSYRGTFLAKHTVQSRKARNRRKRKSYRLLPGAAEQSQHSGSVSAADFEFWATTSDSDVAVENRKAKGEQDNPEAVTTTREVTEEQKQKRQRENEKLVEQMLQEEPSESEASKSSSEESRGAEKDKKIKRGISSDGPTRSSTDSHPDRPYLALSTVDERPGEQDEEDFLGELVTMVSQNPDELFQKVEEIEKCSPEALLTEGTKEADAKNGVSLKGKGMDEEGKILSKFEKEIKKAKLFWESGSQGKRSRSPEDLGPVRAGQDVQKRKLNESESRMKNPTVARMMERMRFTGLLGARGQGLAVPLTAARNDGRSGIGVSGSGIENDENSISMAQSSAGKDTPLVIQKPIPDTKEDTADGTKAKLNQEKASFDVVVLDSDDREHAKKLNDDGFYETEFEDSSVDNGRRAILLDLSVLIKNSRRRRKLAFQKIIASCSDFGSDFDVDSYLRTLERDRTDADDIAQILDVCGLERSEKKCEMIQRELDDAFEAVEPVEYDLDMLNALMSYGREVHFGLFHRGSRRRLTDELSPLLDAQIFVGCASVIVRNGDSWPYLGTWKDLLCRVGVRACQSLFFNNTEDDMLPSGMVAGAIVGARTIKTTRNESGIVMQVAGLQDDRKILNLSLEEFCDDRNAFLNHFLAKPRYQCKRKRVLALHSADGLWYSGVEEFEIPPGTSELSGKSMIRFHHDDKREWVDTEDIVLLERKDFRKVRDAGFPGSFDPDDVTDL